jgi:hypothetical protein
LFRDIPRSILITAVLSLILALILAFDFIPFLRGGFGWQWPYELAALGRVLLLGLVTVVYVAGAWWLLKSEGVGARALHSLRSRALPLQMWAFVGAIAISLAVIYLRSDDILRELFLRTASGVTTGPHMAAAEIDWGGGGWRDWPAVMHSFEGHSVHVQLSPPGLPMWYGFLNAILGTSPDVSDALQRPLMYYQCNNYTLLEYSSAEWASAWFGMLMPLWAALGVFPLYAVARKLVGDSAGFVVSWWPLIPALVLFTGSWNTLYPFLTLLAFWLLLVGMGRGDLIGRPYKVIWLVLSGLTVGLLTFANFSIVPLLLFFGLYVLLRWWQVERLQGQSFWQPILTGVWFGLGLSLPWLIFYLLTGLTPFTLLQTAMNEHLTLDRPYLPWLWLHFWEWTLFTGVPLIVMWLLSASRKRENTLALALLLTMAILLLSGTARGETGRVWLFFSPLVLIVVAAGVGARRALPLQTWLILTIPQAALLIVLTATLPVIGADMKPLPIPPGSINVSQPSSVNVADQFRLTGWGAEVKAGQVTLRLNWETLRQMTIPYWFSALVVGPDGAPVPGATIDWQALQTVYPTTCWKPGEQVGDIITIPLPEDAPAGDYWISLAIFPDQADPEKRLAVTLPDGSQDRQIGLGPVKVP